MQRSGFPTRFLLTFLVFIAAIFPVSAQFEELDSLDFDPVIYSFSEENVAVTLPEFFKKDQSGAIDIELKKDMFGKDRMIKAKK